MKDIEKLKKNAIDQIEKDELDLLPKPVPQSSCNCENSYVNKDFGMCESCCEDYFEKLG
ncbi:MAG TPA: hypothetical protein GXX18_06095 [Bacillales bacterium]|nr:hypothetical protein [Bacillales bacterium]